MPGFMRQLHRLGHRPAVVRDDHEHIDPSADQSLNVADLPSVVAIRRLHEHLRAQLAARA